MSPNYENKIIIIGAGIIGICTALDLKEKGWNVYVVDPCDPGQVTSFGNAGVLSPWSCVPQSIPGLWKSVPKWLLDPKAPLTVSWLYGPRLLPWLIRFLKAGAIEKVKEISDALLTINRPTVELYKGLICGTGHESLIKDAVYLHIFRNPKNASPTSFSWRLRQERGVPLEFLKKGEIQEIEPEISPIFTSGVVIKGQGRCTNPGRLGQVLSKKAQSLGVKFIKQKINRIIPEPDGVYRLLSQPSDFRCKKLVLAAGAWSVELLNSIGIKIPLEAERGYHLIFKNPEISISNSIMDGDRKFVTSSMEMGVRSAGTAEFSGLYSKPNYDRAKIFENLAKQLLPNLNTNTIEEWSGIRPSTPDTIPCIGPVPGHHSIVAAFGHSHLGLTQAPMTARIVSAIVMNEPIHADIRPFQLERFNQQNNQHSCST